MTPITQQEIDAMKAKGDDISAIREAEERLARFRKGKVIVEQIRRAFAGVTLGTGIGLNEARGLDEYAGPETCAQYRAADEKEDWQRITAEELNRCYSSPCFFDVDGMRFHLPAFLIADLRGEFDNRMAFTLTDLFGELSDYSIAQFASLTPPQRAAVRAFLLHILEDPDYEFCRPDIERAFREYWMEN